MDIIAFQGSNGLFPIKNIQALEIKNNTQGDLTIELTVIQKGNEAFYSQLIEDSIVVVNDKSFRMVELEDERFFKRLIGMSTFFDLVTVRKNDIYGGTRTFLEFANFTFASTGWTFTSTVPNTSKFIPNYGANNIVALVRELCAVYGCEFEIRDNNVIHFAVQVGSDKNKQYRYKYNVNNIVRKASTANLRTFIRGFGGNGLQANYTSPNASRFGIREAEPFTDDRYTQADSLIEALRRELNDTPEISIEIDTVEFGQDTEIGERVWLIYEPMDIEFQTRVLEQVVSLRNNKLVVSNITLGNTIPQKASDILTTQKIEIDNSRIEYRSRIEQTNENIVLEVEALNNSIATLDIKADAIEQSVSNQITQEVASLNIRADGIEASVTNQLTQQSTTINQRVDGLIVSVNNELAQQASTFDIRADAIEARVTGTEGNVSSLDIRLGQITSTVATVQQDIGTFESQIIQNANQISSKVSQSDYNGETIASLINQTPSSVTIDAKNINLVGAVTVLSDLSGNLGNITTGNIDISQDVRVGNNIYLGENQSGTKRVVFSDTAAINAGGGSFGADMGFSANSFSFSGGQSFYIDNVTDNRGYVASNTQGLSITQNTVSPNRLVVRVNGRDIGEIVLS